jgi:uncharacterized protein YggE
MLRLPSAAMTQLLAAHVWGVEGRALAQAPQESAVPLANVSGSADLAKPPELIRLQIKQFGRGTDADSARSALLTAQRKLAKAITDSGAEIIVATAGASMASNYRTRYLQELQMQRNRRLAQGEVVPNEKTDSVLFLERFIVVDLKPAQGQKEVLALALTLLDKLQREYAELSGIAAMYSQEPRPENVKADPNLPSPSALRPDTFTTGDARLFIAARLTRQDKQMLLAEAFKKAKTMAGDLAQAADMRLGALHSISSTFPNLTFDPGSQIILGTGEVVRRPPFPDDSGTETILIRQFNYNQTGNYDPLTYRATLNASFRLLPKN